MSLNFSSDKVGLVAVVSAVILLAAPVASEVQINDPDGMTLMQGTFNMDGNSLTNVESISSDGGGNNLEKTLKVNNGLKIEDNALFMDNNNIANAGRVSVVNGPTISGFGIQMSGPPQAYLHGVEQIRMDGSDTELLYLDKLRFNPGGEIVQLGSCSGSGCDIAENIEQAEGADLEKGDVVSIGQKGKLVKTHEEYDSEVAGVVSSSPVIRMGTETGSLDLGGTFDENTTTVVETDAGKKVPLALAGLVPVKASAANGAIEPGDKLTTSGIAGHAMKAEPLIEREGREIYGSGIIGKAMEPLESGKGKIQMLASIE